MLFRDSHVDQTVGIPVRIMVQAGSQFHGRGDRDNPIILRRHFRQCICHEMAPGRLAWLVDPVPGLDIEGRCAMKGLGPFLSLVVTVSFFGQHMDHTGAVAQFRLPQRLLQTSQIVTVNRSEILKSESLKKTDIPIFQKN